MKNISISENPVLIDIPDFIIKVINRLSDSGFKAYVVGGAVRDSVLRQQVTDWDVATSATSGEVKYLFRDIRGFSLKHETVTLVLEGHNYEVTTFRGDKGRVPSIYDDLSHRDFTINAMAYDYHTREILDPFDGRGDMRKGLVRSVGLPRERFYEDPLRLLRAVRLSTNLGFDIESLTMKTIAGMARELSGVAMERIREEMLKILLSHRPSMGFSVLRRSGLLGQFLPELLEGYLKRQNAFHRYTVYRHVMETIDRVRPDPVLRITALLHDIAKPRVRRKINGIFHFYGHEMESARLAEEIMVRLRFSREMIKKVSHLICFHMVDYERSWSDGAVRRLIRRVGRENIEDLIAFRRADLIAHGIRDQKLDLLSELEKRVGNLDRAHMVEGVKELAVGGERVMKILGIGQGPEVGRVLKALVEKVTDQPGLNTEECLLSLLEEMKESGTPQV